MNDLFSHLTTALHEAVPFDHLGVMLHDADRNVMRVALVHPGLPLPLRETPVNFGPAGVILQSQQTMVIHLDTDQPLTGMMPWLRDLGFRVVCGVPLTTARARLGVLVFGSRDATSYDPRAVAVMEQIAAQVALAVEHAVQLERLEVLGASLAAERDRVQFLLRLNHAITSELDLAELLKTVSRLLGETISHHFASLTLWDADRQEFHRHGLLFPSGRGTIRPDVPVPPASPAILAFNAGETMIFRQEDIDRLGGEAARVMREERLAVACCIPIVTARGKYGTLNIASPDAGAFPPEEVALLVSELDYPNVLDKISQALRDVIQHDYASIALYDAESGQMQLQR